jgi:superfamily II DNA or RNA helicase
VKLRPYQQAAIEAVEAGWSEAQRQLGVAATGAGKTIMFSALASRQSGRTLIMAHREELVNQAVEKLRASTGIHADVEKAERRADHDAQVVVASVQTMRRRLLKWDRDHFGLVVADEAHHALSDEWQRVLGHFAPARTLGVTATPDRGDKKGLGQYFQRIAFEITLVQLIGEGHLSPIRALKLPVKLDLRGLKLRAGDYAIDQACDMLEPRLRDVAQVAAREAWDRKMLVFLPRCDVAERFAEALTAEGMQARFVSGASEDRGEVLEWFAKAPPGSALCNAMLLTEGYDQPDVDAILCLRPTKSRALYSQIIGRGTRLAPGKENCLILDPLWLVGQHPLCMPADLTSKDEKRRAATQKRLEEGMDILEATEAAENDVQAAIVEEIDKAERDKTIPRGLIDPLAWGVGIQDGDLAGYEPTMPWEEEPPTERQIAVLEKHGFWLEHMTRGFASKVIDRLTQRSQLGLATPKQLAFIRRQGLHPSPETVTFEVAQKLIGGFLRK